MTLPENFCWIEKWVSSGGVPGLLLWSEEEPGPATIVMSGALDPKQQNKNWGMLRRSRCVLIFP